MKTIRHTETLYHYDGPQIFEARDSIGGHYIAVAVEPEGAEDRYLLTGVSPDRLQSFRLGLSDLRSLMLDGSGDGEWYLATAPRGFGEPLSLTQQEGRLAESDLLPEEGFVLPKPEHVIKMMDFEITSAEVTSVEIRGELQEADLEKGFWRLVTPEGAVFGTAVKGGTILKGLTLGGDYRFVCVVCDSTVEYETDVIVAAAAISKGNGPWRKDAPIGGLRLVNTQLVKA